MMGHRSGQSLLQVWNKVSRTIRKREEEMQELQIRRTERIKYKASKEWIKTSTSDPKTLKNVIKRL